MISVVLVQRSVQLGSMWAGLCGLGASIYLTGQHYSEKPHSVRRGPAFFNCDEVNQHEVYSEMARYQCPYLEVHFSSRFSLWLGGPDPSLKSTTDSAVPAFGGHRECDCLRYHGDHFFRDIGQICPFCVALYGLSLVLLWAGWKAASSPGGSLGARLKGDSSTARPPRMPV